MPKTIKGINYNIHTIKAIKGKLTQLQQREVDLTIIRLFDMIVLPKVQWRVINGINNEAQTLIEESMRSSQSASKEIMTHERSF